MEQDVNVIEGSTVYSSDGETVGRIIAVNPATIVVDQGSFFPTDYFMPMSAIAAVRADGVHLSVTKEMALQLGWEAGPWATRDDQGADTADQGAVRGGELAAGAAAAGRPATPAGRAAAPREVATTAAAAAPVVRVPDSAAESPKPRRIRVRKVQVE